jgi:prepilin-type N-terminal cleavage/methylation domain-containing protein
MKRDWEGRGSEGRGRHGQGSAAAARRGLGLGRRGFTLIELLVVIGIIGILISLTLAVGAKVSAAGRMRVTENALKILDTAGQAFDEAQDGTPPAVAEWLNPIDPTMKVLQPVVDGKFQRADGTFEQVNSVGWFMYQAEKVPTVAPTFQKLDPKLMKKYALSQPGPWDTTQPELATVMDGWGNPIRYVHPSMDGLIQDGPGYVNGTITIGGAATPVDTVDVLGPGEGGLNYGFTGIRRNNIVQSESEQPDSDGGLCTGNKPYFYSAGPDGKVGYLVDNAGKVLEDYNADNIYVVQPTFQKIPKP